MPSSRTSGWSSETSRQKMGFVPELPTDFIFSLIGEELGFIGTVVVLLAYLAILLSGLYIAWRARDTFGHLLAAGITFLITLQAVINAKGTALSLEAGKTYLTEREEMVRMADEKGIAVVVIE